MPQISSFLICFALNFVAVIGKHLRNLQDSNILVGYTITFTDEKGIVYPRKVELRVDAAQNNYTMAYLTGISTNGILRSPGQFPIQGGEVSYNDVKYVPTNRKCPVTQVIKTNADIVGNAQNSVTTFTSIYVPMTAVPTQVPSSIPTIVPTITPTLLPTVEPTIAPSFSPTVEPSVYPTIAPTSYPTVEPSLNPTTAPSLYPTLEPSAYPTIAPSFMPTSTPTHDMLSRHTLGAFNIKIFINQVSNFPFQQFTAQYYDKTFTLLYDKFDDKKANVLVPAKSSPLLDNTYDVSPTLALGFIFREKFYYIQRVGKECLVQTNEGRVGPAVFERINPPPVSGSYDVRLLSTDGQLQASLAGVWMQDIYSIIYDHHDRTQTNLLDVSGKFPFTDVPNGIKHNASNPSCPVTNNGISVLLNGKRVKIYIADNMKCKFMTRDGVSGDVIFYSGL